MKLGKISDSGMPLHAVSEFAKFLAERDHSLQEILNHLARVDLEIFDPDSIIFFQANNSSEFRLVAKSGVDILGESELATTYSLEDDWPVASAIRHGNILWLNEEVKNLEKYPLLANFPLLIGLKNLIICPVFRDGVPEGAFAVITRNNLDHNSESELFLTAIASIFSMYFYRNVLASPDEIEDVDQKSDPLQNDLNSKNKELTQRQLVIMRLISEERTNKSISEFLGYSESTIRQEIMRIFAKTDCGSRCEVANIYKDYSKKEV